MKLRVKLAIVTGGGQGIGEGIVRCLSEEGADVAIVDLNGERPAGRFVCDRPTFTRARKS
jgi:NAD(P)-dependent dehydrogenase (short-subunit alcohol dehydrogenase family)